MGEFRALEWTPRFTESGLSRSQARSGTFRAYVPDRLTGRDFTFGAALAADVADAERSITRLDVAAKTLADTEALARILLRAESVASSRIEGLTVSAQRLLRAGAAQVEGEATTDATALEVLANIEAMSYALEGTEPDITLERILEFHRRLLTPTRLAGEGGRIRSQQNWIGGTSFNPFGASFVPPPHEEVAGLLADLCAFSNSDALPAVAQAAIAHAQFETIHPFVDGNGRTGRALVHMILKRRGLATRTVVPVSLVLATHAQDYIAALQSTRYDGPPDSEDALKSTDEWVALFAGACSKAVADAESFERRVEALTRDWRARLGPLRADASALALLDRLPATPLVTGRSVERVLGVSYTTANATLEKLVSAGILTKTRAGQRNRAFEARELVDAFTDFERQLASVDSDTRISPPARSVPARPAR
jgi:Fic family protein